MPRRHPSAFGPPIGQGLILNRASPQAVGLVGWWPTLGQAGGQLPERVRGQDGTLANTPGWAAEAEMGRAIVYNGSSQYTLIPTINPGTNFTMAAWFKLSGWASNNCVFGTFGSGSDKGYWINIRNSGDIGFWVSTDGSNQIECTWSAGGSLNTLYQMVGTYDGATMRTYVNGVERATVSLSGTLWTVATANATAIARLGAVSGDYINGQIGEVRVYNRTLSAAEVFQLYAPQTRWELYQPVPWTRSMSIAVPGAYRLPLLGVG